MQYSHLIFYVNQWALTRNSEGGQVIISVIWVEDKPNNDEFKASFDTSQS